MADARLIADLKGSEGCKLIAYRDSEGFWTIGFGHLLDQSIDWTGHEITMDTALTLLAQDVDERAAQAATLPEWAALDTDARRNALIECVFNLGIDHWRNEFPRTRQCLIARNWTSAASNLLASPEWIAEVGYKRVARLAQYFSTGQYAPTV